MSPQLLQPASGGAGSGAGDVVGSASSTDNAAARYDSTTGKLLQDSDLIIGDATAGSLPMSTTPGNALALAATAPAAAAGASQAGKAASLAASDAVASTDTPGAAAGGVVTLRSGSAARNASGNANGGDIVFIPGPGIGTGLAGAVCIGGQTANDVGLKTNGGGRLRVVRPDVQGTPYALEAQTLRLYQSDFTTNSFIAATGGGAYVGIYDVSGNPRIKFTRTTNAENSHDAGISSPAAGVVAIDNGLTGGAALQVAEMVAPAALANTARIFAQDNGAGKTQLMVQFGTGTPIQLAIEV